MIIRELYETVCERLLATGKVKYVDLWNHNVEFIEQETAWPRPAVFVEFCPIAWQSQQPGVRYCAEASLNLHIVTEWQGSTAFCTDDKWKENLGVLDLLDSIHEAMRLIDGESFKRLEISKTVMNHNHEDIVETIESYGYVGFLDFKR